MLVLAAVLACAGCQKAPDAPLTPEQPTQEELGEPAAGVPGQDSAEPVAGDSDLPKLVALGAGKCIPCKKMQPDLAELRENYSGAIELVYIDVWKDQEAGARYGIQMIPTQIFFDAQGQELFRHEGYYSKADILAKWEELGMPLQPSGGNSTPEAG
ncbi:MAG: thioredoxin family protein [Thermoguttaceae bacterium]